MIAVDAALIAESAGVRMRIDGKGNVLTCRLDGDTVSLLETVRRSRHMLATIRLAIPVLIRTGLRLDVVAGNVRIGRTGSGVKQNALGRLLRLPATHIGV